MVTNQDWEGVTEYGDDDRTRRGGGDSMIMTTEQIGEVLTMYGDNKARGVGGGGRQ